MRDDVMAKEGKKSKDKKKKRGETMARQADRHVLYEKSVQDPESEIEVLTEKFRELKGRDPMSLREDFCGTALLSVNWCKTGPSRTAIGVDLCEETLAWAKQNNVQPAGKEVSERVTLIHGNVLDTDAPAVDITCAFNFSYNCFNTRSELLQYFCAAHRSLNDQGVLVLDVYGGTEAMSEVEEERDVEGEDFTYVWEQEKFNPITHDTVCHIHFHFPDGTKIKNAFTYEWRLWTLPELRELLTEAGFTRLHIYWEEFVDSDEDDEYLESTGRYVEVTEVENQESWISYIFAER
jgi:SAM-dependent methyltransferase